MVIPCMGLNGTLDTVPATELIQFLGLGRKTGTLSVRSCGSQRDLLFEEGAVVACKSDDPAQFLGELCLRLGIVGEEAMQRARLRAQRERRPLGHALVGEGALDEERLRELLCEKVFEAVRDIIAWKRGSFVFIEGKVLDDDTPRLSVDTQNLLLEVVFRIDQWNVIRSEFPDDDVAVLPIADPILGEVDCEEGRLVLGAIPEHGTTVAALCRRLHRPPFWVYQRLLELQKLSAIRVTPSTTAKKAARERDPRVPLSPAEAAEHLGVSLSTVHRWLKEGILPAEQQAPGAALRVFLTDELVRRLQGGAIPEGWVPLDEAAARLGTTREHVAFLVARGKLRAMRATVGTRRLWRIDLSTADPSIARRRTSA